jgi:hypothetical protein
MSLSVDYNGVSVSFDESDVTETLTDVNCYDSEVVVMGYDADGNEYEAIGSLSCDELVEIYEDSILTAEETAVSTEISDNLEDYLEWLVENNADDGSWVGR